MLEKNDWRLTNQMDFLYEKPLIHVHFQKDSDTWDHEHCEFCMETINDNTKMSYCTLDHYHWICEDCFNDFKEMFKWTVVDK
jgi:hypothetical protein